MLEVIARVDDDGQILRRAAPGSSHARAWRPPRRRIGQRRGRSSEQILLLGTDEGGGRLGRFSRCQASDQNHRARLARLPHEYRGGRGDLVGVTDDGDAQRTAEQIRLTTQVERRRKPRAADRHSDRADAPRTPETVADHDARLAAGQRAQPLTQARGAGIRILGQQQREVAARRIGDIGLIDSRVGHDEPESVLDNQDIFGGAHNAPRFAQNQLDEPRILLHGLRPARAPRHSA